MRPPGRTTRPSSAKNGVEVDEVAQGEPARDAVDGAVGHRQAQDVGLHPRRAAAVGAQHAEAEVDRDRAVAGAGEVDAEVAGAAGQVEHAAAGRQRRARARPAGASARRGGTS